MTVGDWLNQHANSIEAQLMAAEVLGLNRALLRTRLDQELPADERLTRWLNGEPVAYITGKREFYGLEIHVTPDVLIPRPETEHLVESVLETVGQTESVIDVGTGSGCIALAIKAARPDLRVMGVDLSPAALAVAKQNAERLNLDVAFALSDLTANVELNGFHHLVSNPPYVRRSDPNLDARVAQFEPELALYADEEGLGIYCRLAQETRSWPGVLHLEAGFDQADSVAALWHRRNAEFLADLSGHRRVVRLR